MSWFFAAATAVLVVAIYLLRPPPREVTVPSLYIWRGLLDERAPRRELWRWLVSLALALLLAFTLVAALMRSGVLGGRAAGPWVALVIDNGPTMASRDAAGTRFERALELGRDEIRRAPGGARFAVALTHTPGNTWQPTGGFVRASEALDMLDQLVETAAPQSPERTGSATFPALPAPPSGATRRTVLITDGVLPPAPPATAPGEPVVQWLSAYTPVANAGVSLFAIGPDPDGNTTAVLEVVHTAPEAHSVRVRVSDAERVRVERTVELGPGELWSASLDPTRFRPGMLRAEVELLGAPDAFEADNRREAWLPSNRTHQVSFHGFPNRALRQATSALSQVTIDDGATGPDASTIEIWYREAPETPGAFPVLLVAPSPTVWQARDEVSPGTPPDGAQRIRLLRDPSWNWAALVPLEEELRSIALFDLPPQLAQTEASSDRWTPLVSLGDRPLVLASSSPQRAVVVTFDLARYDKSPVLPVLLGVLVDWLSADSYRSDAQADRPLFAATGTPASTRDVSRLNRSIFAADSPDEEAFATADLSTRSAVTWRHFLLLALLVALIEASTFHRRITE